MRQGAFSARTRSRYPPPSRPHELRTDGLLNASSIAAKLLLGLAMAQPTPAPGAPTRAAPTVELVRPSVYMGRGPIETGISGLHASAEVYDIQVQTTYRLADYGHTGIPPGMVYPTTMNLFQAVTRDYDYYGFVSPMLRDVYGHAGKSGDQPTPLQFIQELVQVKNDRGRYLLTEPRVRSLTLELVDEYAVQSGTLSSCQEEVHAWLWTLLPIPLPPKDRSPQTLKASLQLLTGGILRQRMANNPPTGCARPGTWDYVYMSYGFGQSGRAGWLVIAIDYTDPGPEEGPPGKNTRVIPYMGIAGPSRYFSGAYQLDFDPNAATMQLRYGYQIDLGPWPERLITGYHEQILHDFVLVLHERLLELSQEELSQEELSQVPAPTPPPQ